MNNTLTALHYHEAMDRASVAMRHFDHFVNEHSVVQQHPELAAMAQDIIDRMYTLYNTISAMEDKFDPETREWLDSPPRGKELV